MLELSEETRETYSPSGSINWLWFFPGLVVTTGIALVMAVSLVIAFETGFYWIFIAPGLAALATAGVWSLMLKWCHCRNKIMAVGFAVPLALIVYLGYFYLGLLGMMGLDNAHRVDLLPWYINFRMQTDVVRDVHEADPDPAKGPVKGPDLIQQGFNWVFFAGELIMVISIVVGAGLHRSSRAYCESCRRWAKLENAVLPAGVAASIWEALSHGKFAELPGLVSSKTLPPQAGCGLNIEYCPQCSSRPEGAPVYLTVNDIPIPQLDTTKTGELQPVKKQKSRIRKITNQVTLQPKEVVALAVVFPSLKSSIEAQPQIFEKAKQELESVEQKVELQPADWPHQMAQVVVLEGPTSRKILTRTTIALQTFIGLATGLGPIVLALAPPAVILSANKNPPDWLSIIAIVWLFGWLIVGVVWNMYFPNYVTARFMRWRTWRSFIARPDSAVDFLNPELYFVDIVPRANWGKQMLENASDIGFLELNHEHRELIFEGDRERYWIPVDSILEVKHEFFAEPMVQQHQKSPSLHHLIVVRAMTENGPWEASFYRRHHKFRVRTEARKLEDSLELEAKIRALIGP